MSISPVFEGGEGWDLVPEGMISMGPENLYRIHDPQPDPAHPVADFILSHAVLRQMNHAQAVAYCRDRGAQLPDEHQLRALGRAMGRRQPGGYNPNLIPEMDVQWFWSSSVHPNYPNRAFYFYGGHGNVDSSLRYSPNACLRCVVPWQRG